MDGSIADCYRESDAIHGLDFSVLMAEIRLSGGIDKFSRNLQAPGGMDAFSRKVEIEKIVREEYARR